MSGFFGDGGGGGVANPLTGTLDANYNEILNAVLAAYAEKVQTLSAVATNQDLDLSMYNVFLVELAGDVTLTFINPPASGACGATVILAQDGTGGRDVTFAGKDSGGAAGSIVYPNGVTPTQTTTLNKSDVWSFFTINGDGVYIGGIGPSNLNY
jgi:hypothetical protein